MENSFLKEFKDREYFNQCTNSEELELSNLKPEELIISLDQLIDMTIRSLFQKE